VNVRSLSAGVLAVALAVGSTWAWRDGGASTTGRDGGAVARATDVDGVTLFAAKGCAWCHRSASTEPFGDGFPDLTDVADWGGTRRAGMDAAEYITESVRSPTAFISPEWEPSGGPTDGMPGLVVSDSELDAIIQYLVGQSETDEGREGW
jgi:cytochrome c5